MSRKYVLRITRKHGATTQHTGTLKQILKTQVGAPAPYSRHVDEDDLLDTPCGAYQWFIDHPTIPPEVRVRGVFLLVCGSGVLGSVAGLVLTGGCLGVASVGFFS